jgi:hypothetical protein
MAVSDDIRIYVDAAVPATLNDGAAALHRRDVNEDVLATALRLDEAVTLGGVEPFHGTVGILTAPIEYCRRGHRAHAARYDLRRSV